MYIFYIYDKIQSRECYEMRRRLKNKITTLVEIQYTNKGAKPYRIRVRQFLNAPIVIDRCMGAVTKYATINVRSIYTSIWTCQEMFYVYVEEENLPLHVFIYKCKYRYM